MVLRFLVHHQNPIDHLFHLIQEVQHVHDVLALPYYQLCLGGLGVPGHPIFQLTQLIHASLQVLCLPVFHHLQVAHHHQQVPQGPVLLQVPPLRQVHDYPLRLVVHPFLSRLVSPDFRYFQADLELQLALEIPLIP